MDSDELVDFQIDAGQRLLTQLVHDHFDVTAAFWAKTVEEGTWFFYVATPLVEQRGHTETYRVLQASLQKLQGIPLSLSEIKLVGAGSPVARDLLAIRSRYPGRLATRYGGRQLGNESIEGAYIYPQYNDPAQDAGAMPTEDVLRELLRLMNRGPGTLLPSKVTLKNGGSFEGIPFSIQMGSHRAMVVQFIDNAEPLPRVVEVNEIASVS